MAKVANRAVGRPIDPQRIKNAERALILSGGNIKEAAKATGYQVRTIASYIDRGFIDPSVKIDGDERLATLDLAAIDRATEERNADLAEKMLATAEAAMGQVDSRLHEASAKDAMTIAGRAVETSQLLKGKATKVVDVNVSSDLETLRRYGILIEGEVEEVTEAEVVE